MQKRVIVGVLGLIWLVAGLAHSDTIGLYAEASGTSCNIAETFPLTYVYVVHVTDGAAASEFSAPKPVCWTGATWVGDQCAFFPCFDGPSQTGMMIGYGSCKVGAIHILTIVYSVQGPSPSCCLYPLLRDPRYAWETPVVVDCKENLVSAVGLVTTINGNATCPCGYPVPVEETTWGSVKALYGE
jgi:hypothetical protein